MSGPSAPTDGCHYCGLPLPGRRRPAAGPEYCCVGCRIAESIAQGRGPEGQATWALTRLGLGVFFSLNAMVFSCALWAQDVYPAGDAGGAAAVWHDLLRYGALLFSAPVLLLLGPPLAEGAWAGLRRGAPTTDVLLLAGVIASFAYSLLSLFRGAGQVYFDTACMVLTAVTLGRWLEATGKLRTTAALRSLEKLLPERVRLVRDGAEIEVPLAQAAAGSLVRVLPGERIPVDGAVRGGQAAVDQQAVTGESEPVSLGPGDRVLSGGLNLDGSLLIEASAAADRGALRRLVDAVVEAAGRKERYQRLADRVSAWFLPAVAAVAAGTLLAHGLSAGLGPGLAAALAVVLIACPCALGLATPMALWAALGRASRAQTLFREGDVVSQLAGVRTVCFDKTGTLTTGRSEVAEFTAEGDEGAALAATSALARGTVHSAAAAAGRYAGGVTTREEEFTTEDTESTEGGEGQRGGGFKGVAGAVRTLPGRGVTGEVCVGRRPVAAWLGSERLMAEQGLAFSPRLAEACAAAHAAARSTLCVGWDGQVRGVFALTERLRPEAAAAVEHCRRLGLAVVVLTGDHARRAAVVAEELGVEARAGLLPEDKLAAIRELRRRGPVAMVGDGLNDAPALAEADVGVALGCGADVSRQTAAVCLLGDNLARFPEAVELARRTVRTIRWNLGWAFLYNTAGIALAAAGWLNPILAAAAMAVSSVMVISNSLRLADDGAAAGGPTPSSGPQAGGGEAVLPAAAANTAEGSPAEPALAGEVRG